MTRLTEPTRLTLYVDGSCDGNQNVDASTLAGWGVVIVIGDSGLGRGSGEILAELSGPVVTSQGMMNSLALKLVQTIQLNFQPLRDVALDIDRGTR